MTSVSTIFKSYRARTSLTFDRLFPACWGVTVGGAWSGLLRLVETEQMVLTTWPAVASGGRSTRSSLSGAVLVGDEGVGGRSWSAGSPRRGGPPARVTTDEVVGGGRGRR